uniref:Uncharacterized protein n=1 Tax=Chromera velia CCMP2878 TaxID=1169474 RepID=A0A0G4FEG0_9ALVE|eukprot:Cvel_16593.t1-p1 / transcript=Cvel_16593.t1 / gene=Cvel_16593 / organism=Chromera_velia_CCMP2878 / gene_product=hypothetical protein / transcript_product=hypothetical protein / location=Cvel_scaffold1285:14136-15422(-) / protein_length=429 / sequence_SO=supercontig / SO=protein_coding / is_pseudo=false
MADRLHTDVWERADKELGNSFVRSMRLTPEEWIQKKEQIYLPLCQGGLGIPFFRHIAPAALVGCGAQTLAAVRGRLTDQGFATPTQSDFAGLHWVKRVAQAYTDCRGGVQRELGQNHIPRVLQSEWGERIDDFLIHERGEMQHLMIEALHLVRREQLLNALSPPGKARLKSCSGTGASAWLTAMPSSGWTKISPTLFTTAVRLRLGLPIPEIKRNPICACGATLDHEGQHAQTCGTGGGVWWRHEQMKDAFCSLLQGLRHCYVTREPTFGQLGLSTPTRLVNERQKRPDFLAGLPSGDTVLGDVAVTHPFSIDANRLRRFAKTAGSAAKAMEKVKNDRYGEICHEIGFRFVPLVFETYGRPGEGTIRFLKEIAKLGAGRVRGGEGDEAVQTRLMDRYYKVSFLHATAFRCRKSSLFNSQQEGNQRALPA